MSPGGEKFTCIENIAFSVFDFGGKLQSIIGNDGFSRVFKVSI